MAEAVEKIPADLDFVYTKLTSITWSMGLLHNFNSMRLKNEMCDIQVSLKGGIIIPAHSCVLAGASPFLKSLLVDVTNPEIHMESFPAHLVEQIVEFIYTGTATVKKQELFLFQSIAATLKISTLTDMATKLIQDSVFGAEDRPTPEPAEGTKSNLPESKTFLIVTPDKKSPKPMISLLKKEALTKNDSNPSDSTESESGLVTKKCATNVTKEEEGDTAARCKGTPRKSQRQRKPSTKYMNEVTSLNGRIKNSPVNMAAAKGPASDFKQTSATLSGLVQVKQEIDNMAEYESAVDDSTDAAQGELPSSDANFQPEEVVDDFNISEVASDSKLAKSLEVVVSQLEEEALGNEDQPEGSGQQSPTGRVLENIPEDNMDTGSETLEADINIINEYIPDEGQAETEDSNVDPKLPDAIQVLQKKGDSFFLETVIPVIENYAEAPSKEKENNHGDIHEKLRLPGRKLSGISSLMCQQVPVHNGLTFMCEICSRCFTDQGVFERHRQKHDVIQQEDDPQKRFHCTYCPFKTKYKHILQEHERTHTGVKPYKCQYCEKSFSHKKNHKMHESLHQDLTLPCPHCDKVFSYRPNLRKHIKVVHNPGFRPHKCPFCSQCFKIPDTLKKHLVTHTDMRPYKCPRCEKAYFDKQALTKHVRNVHENSGKRFSCDACGKEYKCKASIVKHKCTKTKGQAIHRKSPKKKKTEPTVEPQSGHEIVATVDMVDPKALAVSTLRDGDSFSDGETSSDSDMDIDDLVNNT